MDWKLYGRMITAVEHARAGLAQDEQGFSFGVVGCRVQGSGKIGFTMTSN